MRTSAIIVAAGRGNRIGGEAPKQFRKVLGKPILYYTLFKFEQCPAVDDVILVASTDWQFHAADIVDEFGLRKVTKIVVGGSQRQDSVFKALQSLEGQTKIVLVHDAVRPFVSKAKLEEVIVAGKQHGAAILAVPPRDTIKSEADGFVKQTLDRKLLWSVQTPQVFAADLLRKAYESAFNNGIYQTDDSALVERIGHRVKIVMGENSNIKITVPTDLMLAELLLKESD